MDWVCVVRRRIVCGWEGCGDVFRRRRRFREDDVGGIWVRRRVGMRVECEIESVRLVLCGV